MTTSVNGSSHLGPDQRFSGMLLWVLSVIPKFLKIAGGWMLPEFTFCQASHQTVHTGQLHFWMCGRKISTLILVCLGTQEFSYQVWVGELTFLSFFLLLLDIFWQEIIIGNRVLELDTYFILAWQFLDSNINNCWSGLALLTTEHIYLGLNLELLISNATCFAAAPTRCESSLE